MNASQIVRCEPKDVFFVWTRTGHKPCYAHADEQKARNEAERLALLNPGKKFIVMRCLGKYSVSPEHVGAVVCAINEAVADVVTGMRA